jgi:cation:H+ antiporter
VSGLAALALFGGGVALVVAATERLLEGLVGLARAARVAPFVAGAVLSGLEAENIAVGLAAGHDGAAEIALGTVFGGAIFIVCAALGVGALLAPLEVRLPRSVVISMVAAAAFTGLPLVSETTSRLAGAALLVLFAVAMIHLVRVSRRHRFIGSDELREAAEKTWPAWLAALTTVLGLGLIALGGELVARGAVRLVDVLGLSAALVGMVITPAAIEAEEVARQVIPARRGYPDVAAGNVIGTVLYFTLFNLGLIALITPVRVPALTRQLDYPYLVGTVALAGLLLARGRIGRLEGALLTLLAVVFAGLHAVLR